MQVRRWSTAFAEDDTARERAAFPTQPSIPAPLKETSR
jgi:hypothetical protein